MTARILRSGFLWRCLATCTVFFVALPLLTVLYTALFPSENLWPHLWQTTLPGYLITTFGLMLGVGLGTFLFGVSTAWLITNCEFPGRRWLEWALLLPFAVPAYVIAYTYTDLLEYSGPVQSTLRAIFAWTSPRDYWFPSIRSLGGAITVMSLVLYPYVYLTARAAFVEQSGTLFSVSRSLGYSARQTFFRVSLPIARPAIVVGLSLVLMETLNDFGTVDYFAVRTLTAGLYDAWLNMGNLGGAAQIASCMLLFVLLLLTLERQARRTRQLFGGRENPQQMMRFHLTRGRGVAALCTCLTPVLLGFLIPASVLSVHAWTYFEQSWTPTFLRYLSNSLSLAATAAALTTLLGLLLAYAQRMQPGRWMRSLVRLSGLGYALPGAVLAIGVIIPAAAFDNAIDSLARDWLGFSTGLLISGSVLALLYAYNVRFLAVSTGAVETGLEKILPSMDMAARSLGSKPLANLWRIHIPLLRSGLLTAVLIVFVDCLKELPATLILRPFNFETLATYVYQFASDEQLERASLAALLIVFAGVLPVIMLSRAITHSRQFSA